MRDFLVRCSDFIFPPSEDTLLVRNLSEDDMQRHFCVQNIDGVYALSSFSDIHIRALVHEAKFHCNTRAFMLLSLLFKEFLAQNEKRSDAVIPIPLSPARIRARGFNQVHETLRAGRLSLPIETSVLIRVRDTRPQTELSRSERLTNMSGAFGVRHVEKIKGKRVLLLDDVTTTGTTLAAAKAALLPHAASVTCVALAH